MLSRARRHVSPAGLGAPLTGVRRSWLGEHSLRRTVRSAAAIGGLLALLLLPSVVSAHDITDVQIDCAGGAIVVSGTSFGEDGGDAVTVTVSGPDGYVQTFAVEPVVPWTVSLPLGPSGTYTIDWPGSGGAVTFTVECENGSQPPATDSPTPSQPPDTTSPTPSEPPPTPRPTPVRPTPSPTRTPAVSPTPAHTLPPTDAMTPTSAVSRTDTVLASLLFIAVLASAVALRRTAQGRTRRR